MRDIKFRMWNKEQKRWASHFELLNDAPISANIIVPCAVTLGREDSEWKFVEYTGWHDENQKEIFEGDIVGRNVTNMRAVVERGRDGWIVVIHTPKEKFVQKLGVLWHVIGNVYENPELLSPSRPASQTLT